MRIKQKAAIRHPRSAGAYLKPAGYLSNHIHPLLISHNIDPSFTKVNSYAHFVIVIIVLLIENKTKQAGVAIIAALAYYQWNTVAKDIQPYLASVFGDALVRLLSHPDSNVQHEAAHAIWNISYL